MQRLPRARGFTRSYHNNLVTLPIAVLLAWLSFGCMERPILAYCRRAIAAHRMERPASDAEMAERTAA